MAGAAISRHLFGLQRGPGIGGALALALLVHAALVVALVVSVRWNTAPVPRVLRAVVIDADEVPVRESEARRRDETARKADAEKRRSGEAKVRAQEAERLRLAEETKKKQAAEEKRRKTDAAKRRQKESERSLKEQLAAEEKSRAEAAQEARVLDEVDRQVVVIRQKVERNWNRPPGAGKGLSCVVRVRLVQSGEVLGATVVRGSGNAFFDRSVENAVYKASPLPLPADPELFEHFREIEFVFEPKE
jgi:colicin import membrane protein